MKNAMPFMLSSTTRPGLLAGVFFVALSNASWSQETPIQPTDAPLSVIDWLDDQAQPSTENTAQQNTDQQAEPPVTQSGAAPVVTSAPLGPGRPREIGLVPTQVTGLPAQLWSGSKVDVLTQKLADLPDPRLPAAQSLLYTLLLAEAQAPQGIARDGDKLALARVRKLIELGALEPAMSLIEQAGVAASPEHFDLWAQVSLLNGTEDNVCTRLSAAPHLGTDYGLRIFCAARDGKWENAALTFGSAQALGLLSEDKLALLDHFLHPDAFEGQPPQLAPLKMDPLMFRLFETIGEPLPTRNLPRAYAVADLRDLAGWKAQLEAAERLTRAGALPDNHLLGLYTNRRPAASGGVWDRVAALQRFETALKTGSPEAVSKTLPPVWAAVEEASLQIAFASLFSDQLTEQQLTDRAADIANIVGFLSPGYEKYASTLTPNTPEMALLQAVALGARPTERPKGAITGAVYEGFSTAQPLPDIISRAQSGQLGEAILELVALLELGARGDTDALRDSLATLRALGLEDAARRAALQVLLLRRNA